MTLEQLMQEGFRSAKNIIEERGEEAIPVFLAEWGDGQIAIYGAPWRNDKEKYMTIDALRVIFAARRVKRYVMVCEAWVVKLDKDEEWDGTRASQHPQRIEVVSVVGIEPGRAVCQHAEIAREGGRRRVNTLERVFEGASVQGDMTELLPDASWPTAPAGAAEEMERMLQERLPVKIDKLPNPTIH